MEECNELPFPEPEPKLDVLARTFPTLGCLCKQGPIGGTCEHRGEQKI